MVTETVIIEHVFSLRHLVNSFTDVSFLMVTNGEKDFWATGIFFWRNTTSSHWDKLEAVAQNQSLNNNSRG